MKNPLVTVLITAHNAEKTLRDALDSILGQTYKNIEVIVVDDVSTDFTRKILKGYGKKVKTIFLKRNVGPTLAANPGLKVAKGKYIARMDADDIACPTRMEKQVNYLEKNPDVVLLGGQCRLINEEGRATGTKKFPTKHKDVYEAMFFRNPVQHPTVMINKSLVPSRELKYDNHSRMADDLDFYFKLAQYGKLANLNTNTLYYRQSFNSHSLKNIKKTFKHTMEVRLRAIVKHGYKPTFRGWMLCLGQVLVVPFLPDRWIHTLFSLAMGMKKIGIALPSIKIIKPRLAKVLS